MILVIKSRWNESITTPLAEAAEKFLREHGVETDRFDVPGALEIPLAVEWAAAKFQNKLEGVVACGAVIEGETLHFDLVARDCSQALMDLSLKWRVPVGHAVLACRNIDQAIHRSTGTSNKGLEAAQAVYEMLQLKKQKELVFR